MSTTRTSRRGPSRFVHAHKAGLGLVCCLLLLLLNTCGGTGAASSTTPIAYNATTLTMQADLLPYHDPTFAFDMQFPRQWYMGQSSGSGYGIVAASSTDPSVPRAALSVAVEKVNGSIDLLQAAHTAEASLRAQSGVAGFTVDDSQPATVNGEPAQERSYSYILNQQKIHQRSVYIGHQNVLYDLSLIAPQDLYGRYDQLFTNVVATFRGASL
jgi:hypothetical protein